MIADLIQAYIVGSVCAAPVGGSVILWLSVRRGFSLLTYAD